MNSITKRDHRYIFIAGNSRSGTTMLGHILGNHPGVHTFRELHFFEQLFSPEYQKRHLSDKESGAVIAELLSIETIGYLKKRDPGDFIPAGEQILFPFRNQRLTAPETYRCFLDHQLKKKGKFIACEHTPQNVFYIREILDAYPEALVINIVRDPRDILLSQKNKWKRRSLGMTHVPFLSETLRSMINYHPVTTSMLWVSALQRTEKTVDSTRVKTVYFEDILSHPEQTVENICRFLRIRYRSDMLDIPVMGSSHSPDHPYRRGVDSSITGRWRQKGLNATEIYLCQRVAGKTMRRHGYSEIQIDPEPWRLLYYTTIWPIKSALALVLNLSRIKNIAGAIRRRFS